MPLETSLLAQCILDRRGLVIVKPHYDRGTIGRSQACRIPLKISLVEDPDSFTRSIASFTTACGTGQSGASVSVEDRIGSSV